MEQPKASASPRPPRPSLILRTAMAISFIILVITFAIIQRKLFNGGQRERTTPINPAGYAFSIWGIIWFLQAAGCIYSFLPADYGDSREWKKNMVEAVGPFWTVGFVLELAWGLAQLRKNKVTVILDPFFLGGGCACFTAALFRLGWLGFYSLKPQRQGGVRRTLLLLALYIVPTGLNAAWLTAATTITMLEAPLTFGVPFDSLVPGAVVLIIVAALFALVVAACLGDLAFGLTIIWALIAIITNQDSAVVRGTSLGAIILVALGLGVAFVLGVLAKPPPPEEAAGKLRIHVILDHFRGRPAHVAAFRESSAPV